MLSPRVRQLVRWRRVNLMEDLTRLGRFDLILCRNQMGYLHEDARAQVLASLRGALAPDGWLVLGAKETVPGFTAAAGRPGFYGQERAPRAA